MAFSFGFLRLHPLRPVGDARSHRPSRAETRGGASPSCTSGTRGSRGHPLARLCRGSDTQQLCRSVWTARNQGELAWTTHSRT